MSGHNYRISVIPAGAVIDPRLKAQDIRVLALLGRHTNKHGWCRRSQTEMAKELGCSRGTVQGAIARAVEAGWVEVKLEGRGSVGPDPDKQPFAAHSYRVLLDGEREPPAMPEAHDDGETEGGCQHIGTPGANPDVAPGANPGVAPGANPGVAPLEEVSSNQLSEQGERDARASRPVKEFTDVWPTAAIDDLDRTARAWASLSALDRDAAFDAIPTFLESLKQHRGAKAHVPAGWTYLEQRRWELLPKPPAPETTQGVVFTRWSRDWWAALIARCQRGAPVAMMISQATHDPKGNWQERAGDMPPADVIAAFKGFPSDGEVMAAWLPWFERHGVKLPLWRSRFWVHLPGEYPPVEAADEVEAEEVEDDGSTEAE
jgi:hypothetical protein